MLIADLRGSRVRGRIDQKRSNELSSEVDLRDGAIHLDREQFELDTQRWAERLAYNETTIAPKDVSFDDLGCLLTIGVSTRSRFHAAGEQLGAVEDELRIASMSANPLGTAPAFTHTLGVNCTLETSDGQLVTTRRSFATATGAGRLNVAMSEAANIEDALGFEFDPSRTLLRGLYEELGIRRDDVVNHEFHSLVADVDDGGVALLAHARTKLTAEQVIAHHARAQDRDEVRELIFRPMMAEQFEVLLTTRNEDWVAWAAPTMIGTAGLCFGDRAAAALEQRLGQVAPVS